MEYTFNVFTGAARRIPSYRKQKMKQIAWLLLLAILITGCDQNIKPAAPAASKSVQRPTKELVSSWAKKGMYLPDASQVAAFRGDFEHSAELLRNGLDDSNSS